MIALSKLTRLLLPVFLCGFVFSVSVLAQDEDRKEAGKKGANKKEAKKDDNGEHLKLLGKPVLVTKAGAELKTRKGVVWKAYLGEVFTVAEVEGEWYWIREKGGWLWKKNTVPLDTSVALFSAEIAKKPTAEAFHQRGIAYSAMEDHQNAIKDFTKTIELKPQYAGAYVNRGNSKRALELDSEALSDYSTAITLDDKNFVAYNNRGLVETDMRQFDKAMADFDRAIALSREYAEAYNNRGVVWREKGDLKKAIANYNAAIKIYPAFAEAFGNRAFALNKLKQFDAALANYSHAVRLRPFDAKMLNDLAWMVATCPDKRFREPKLALKDARKACEITKNEDWNTLDTLGAAHALNENFDEAVKAAEAALKLAPSEKKNGIQQRISLYKKKKPFMSS